MNDLPLLHGGCSLRLVLLRHGEPSLTRPDVCYGKLDVDLSSNGVRQIQDKLPFLKLANPEVIFTSPRKRAMETARIVGAALGLTPHAMEELAEIDFGGFEGRTYDEIQRLYPGEYKMWMEKPTAITFPGGENYAALKKRVLGFIATLRERPAARTVAIIAHGGVNRVVLADALGMTDEMSFRIDQPFAAASVIDYFGETPVVRLVNG